MSGDAKVWKSNKSRKSKKKSQVEEEEEEEVAEAAVAVTVAEVASWQNFNKALLLAAFCMPNEPRAVGQSGRDPADQRGSNKKFKMFHMREKKVKKWKGICQRSRTQ